ncbi:hypothetical protein ABE525_07335 [Pseudomonas wadenswilerensis]|nr:MULTISPECIES: hypothetical protein [Pseudomonas]
MVSVELATSGKISARDMKHWIEQYERCEINSQPAPKVSTES